MQVYYVTYICIIYYIIFFKYVHNIYILHFLNIIDFKTKYKTFNFYSQKLRFVFLNYKFLILKKNSIIMITNHNFVNI